MSLALAGIVFGIMVAQGQDASPASQVSTGKVQASAPIVLPPQLGPVVMPEDLSQSAGFRCEVVVSALDRPGYVGVRVTLLHDLTTTVQRRMTARLVPERQGITPPGNQIPIDMPFTIEQGELKTECFRRVPKWFIGSSYRFELYEDGRLLPQYTAELGTFKRGRSDPIDKIIEQEVDHRWLAIDAEDETANRELESSLASLGEWWQAMSFTRSREFYSRFGLNRIPSQSASTLPLSRFKSSELPDDWRDFQSYDIVVLHRDSMESLRKNEPQSYRSLRHWLLLGGTVVVVGVDDFKDMASSVGENDAATAQVIQANQTRVAQALGDNERALAAIESIANSVGNFFVGDQNQLQAYQEQMSETLEKIQQVHTARRMEAAVSQGALTNKLEFMSVGAGRVIGIHASVAPSAGLWGLIGQLQAGWGSPALRRGVDPVLGDSRFRRWLIPGVAQPPVYTFIGLLTAFVILVGPISYRQTTKRGRGYLMFAIAPILALVTTASMFLYGIIADGFGTVTRVRQLTWVDHASGDAVTRVRASYFAGIRPADGLKFDADAEVMGYPDGSERSREIAFQVEAPAVATVRVDGEHQVFSSGLLPSRQQRQFIVHQAMEDIGKISAVRETNASGKDSLSVTNKLKIDLRDIIFRDVQGDYWYAEQLAAGALIVIDEPLAQAARSKRLGDLFNRQRLIEDISTSRQMSYTGRNRADDAILELNGMFFADDREVTDGALERWMRENLQLGGAIPEGTFIGVSDVDRRQVAVAEAEIVESVHYVMGTHQ